MLIKGLSVKIRDRLILNEVGLEFIKGLNVILGPNGSGKTTLLRCIIGMIKPSEGRIEIEEKEKSYSPAEFFSAEMNVMDVLLAGGSKKDYMRYLKLLGIDNFINRNFSTLSTGEKRLVLIAKALAEGDLVLIDEPTSGLDLKNQINVRNILSSLKDKMIITCTHDISIATIADRVALLKEGRIIAQGEPVYVLTEELLSDLYGVKIKRIWVDDRNFVFV